jgi:putative transposase
MYYNRRHRRHGLLFQNRYKSILCQEETYLRELVRYIHLNPLRAGLVEDMKALDTHPYCGHSALVANVKKDWQQVDYVLGFFGKRKAEARKRYRNFVAEGIEHGKRLDLNGAGLLRGIGGCAALKSLRSQKDWVKSDERILGDSDFVTSVLQRADEQMENSYRLKSEGFGLDDVAKRVAHVMSLPLEIVWEKSRRPQTVQARSLLCYWAAMKLGMSMTEIAKQNGYSLCDK